VVQRAQADQARSLGAKQLTNVGGGRPLNNLFTRMPEFKHFTAQSGKRWTLPMAAAWFIWRDLAAVDDQWKIVTGAWLPHFDPPGFILEHGRRQPGTLTCVFQQAGFARGQRPYVGLQDIPDRPSTETSDPYERLRVALQSGRLRARVVDESLEESDWFMDDWLDFDVLGDPSSMDEAACHPLSDPTQRAVLVSTEEAIGAEAELSAAEAGRYVWKPEQTLGWIAYRRDGTFRSLGRTDLQPPTFFGRRYKSDFDDPQPLTTLTSALLSEKIHVDVQGTALTRAECISLLNAKDGLWGNNDVTFVPDEVRDVWQRKAVRSLKSFRGEKDLALTELTEILIAGKRRKIRVLYPDAEKWMGQKYKIKGKAVRTIWGRARKHPDVEEDTGRPTEAERVASATFFQSYPKTLPENPHK
jgi:hypothetical protein